PDRAIDEKFEKAAATKVPSILQKTSKQDFSALDDIWEETKILTTVNQYRRAKNHKILFSTKAETRRVVKLNASTALLNELKALKDKMDNYGDFNSCVSRMLTAVIQATSKLQKVSS